MGIASSFVLKIGDAPPAPKLADEVVIYFKSDKQLYYKGSDNIERPFNGMIPGGLTGQMLVKKTNADFEMEWKDIEVEQQFVTYEGNLPPLSNYPDGTIFIKKE